MFKLYSLILTTFEEEQEKIKIPIIRNKQDNKLRKQWELIVRLEEVSKLIEEVFAVRASLREAREGGLVQDNWQLEALKDHYKNEYGKDIDGFEKAYEEFDLVAERIGEDATLAMIYSVFETLNPEAAFLDILVKMCSSNPSVPTNGMQGYVSKSADFIAKLSYEQALHFFSGFINWVDPDDSCYGRKAMLDITNEIKEKRNVLVREVRHDFTKFLVGSPDVVLFSAYDSDGIHPFAEITRYGDIVRHKVYYGNYALVLEAIRQQLTQGKGLLCPFWLYLPGTCCGSDNRALLEKVWKCTSHNRSCNWKRMGCLEDR
jgi:hypothetical protein